AALCLGAVGCAGSDIPVDAAPENILAHAEEKLAAGKHLDAVEAYQYFLRTHPGTAMTPLAKLRLGDARFGLGEYILAEGEYQQIVSDFPASPLVEEARFKIALCAYESTFPFNRDQSETERALVLFDDFLRDYPESRFRPEVATAMADCRGRLAHGEFESGKFYEHRKRYRPAAIQYKYVVEGYPDTEWASQAALRLAGMYVSRERWDTATTWYRKILRDWPGTEAAAAAEEALGALPSGQTLSNVPTPEGAP
ncbi:MAG TPA: outer membrane protein assembly factor BamD, partial [bacterium]|nr:outer membrane protein assembly factor BamD [bacterium]